MIKYKSGLRLKQHQVVSVMLLCLRLCFHFTLFPFLWQIYPKAGIWGRYFKFRIYLCIFSLSIFAFFSIDLFFMNFPRLNSSSMPNLLEFPTKMYKIYLKVIWKEKRGEYRFVNRVMYSIKRPQQHMPCESSYRCLDPPSYWLTHPSILFFWLGFFIGLFLYQLCLFC